MKKLFPFLFAFAGLSLEAQSIDSIINAQMAQQHIPAVQALVLKKGTPIWYNTYGWLNIDTQQPANNGTAFMLASVSKTVTATALMHVWENGGFQLDDDINNYLPFAVNNPNYPNTPITFKHLLTHTSGIADDWDILEPLYVEADSPIALGDFCEDYLTPNGTYYNANTCYSNNAPGSTYDYTNVGTALCGYLVESITGINFSQYCRDSIFTPLCMTNTAWFIAELNFNFVALPYFYENGVYNGVPHYGYPDYPDGQLRTNALSLGRFLNMYMNYGEHNGTRILDSTTVALMLSEQIPGIEAGQGFIWYNYTIQGSTVWGHSGGDTGVSTEMLFSTDDSLGVIVLTNGDDIDLDPILNALYTLGKNMADDAAGYPCSLTAVAEQVAIGKESVKLYPNPAHQLINVEFTPQLTETPLQIYDAKGLLVGRFMETMTGKSTIDISNLRPGIYTLVHNGTSKMFVVD